MAGGNVSRILVIKLDNLGDVVLASPFFRELRRNFPEATITAATTAGSAALMRSCPYVNHTAQMSVNPLNLFALKRFARSLQNRFGVPDLTLIPRFSVDPYGAGWIGFFSGAQIRAGFSESATARKSRLNRGADALFTNLVLSKGVKHEVERNLDLLGNLGLTVADSKLEIWFSESEKRDADSMLGTAVDGDAPLIAVGLGATQTKRMWPVERYAEVCRSLHAQTGARFVVMGSHSEKLLMKSFQNSLGDAIAVSGTVSLGVVAALFSRCSLFLGSDSAQKHIAAAVGLPVVEVSCHPVDGDATGNNSPVRFHAWGVPYIVLQPPSATMPCRGGCDALAPHCILQIGVSEVERSARALLTSARSLNSTPALK